MSEAASAPQGAAQSFTLGHLRIHLLDAGLQRLDGGAMFGVVPKPLWERRIPADERNRIPLAMRCVLVEAPEALVLLDTGAGHKEDERFRDIYGLENEGRPTRLEDSLRVAGFEPEDVDLVVDTHLHFDHAGGNTVRDASGRIQPAFPNATYVMAEGELAWSRSRNPRVRASYLPDNFEPLVESGRVRTVADGAAITAGIQFVHTPGHTPHHQSVLLDGEGVRACFLADVCPTTAHVPLPWIMGYDVEPLVTLDAKQALWERALEEDWTLLFEHDPVVGRARLQHDDGRWSAQPLSDGASPPEGSTP